MRKKKVKKTLSKEFFRGSPTVLYCLIKKELFLISMIKYI